MNLVSRCRLGVLTQLNLPEVGTINGMDIDNCMLVKAEESGQI